MALAFDNLEEFQSFHDEWRSDPGTDEALQELGGMLDGPWTEEVWNLQ